MTIYKRLVFILLLLSVSAPVWGQCTLSASIAASNNNVICSGNSVVLTVTPGGGTAPYTYIWNTGETTAAISVNRAGTYTVSVSDQTDGCQPVSQSITVTETPSPDAPTVASVVVCQNASAILRATGPGGNYAWYDAPTGGNLIGTGDVYTTPPITAATTYYVETSLGGCTGPRAAANVTLSGTPVVSGAQICAGNTAVLHVSGGDSYTWYDKPGGTVLGTGPSFTTPPLTASLNYFVVSVINGCASGAIPVPVFVTPYPEAPTVQGATVCQGTAANMHATATGVIDWFDVPVGGTSLITSPDYTTPALTATTTYYVQSSLNGCVSQRTAVTINVNAIPDAPAISPVTICAGTTATLTASSTAGGAYNWYTNADGTNLVFTGSTFQTPVLNSTTTYFVKTMNGSCISPLTAVQVTVTPNPPAPTATVTPVCLNTPATLTAINPGGDYAWFDAPNGGNQLGTGATFTTPALAVNTTYYLQTTVNGCTSVRTAVVATVLPPAAPPTAAATAVCSGSSATLIAAGSDNYQWYDAATDGNLLTAGRVFVTPALTANTTYYVQTIRDGCTSTRTAVTVTVNPTPAPPTVSGANICPGSPATLTAGVAAGSTVRWYDAENGGNLLATGTSFTTPILYDSATYYVESETAAGCVSARSAVAVSTTPVVYPQFQYSSGTFCKTGGSVIPTINDPAGGTFSASGTGLVFTDKHTGEINIAASTAGVYIVTFVGNETCRSVTTTQIAILNVLDSRFSYSGPFCQYGPTNPGPAYPTGAGGGVFTAVPSGLVFLDNTSGMIDLKKSLPGTYTVTNTIPADGTCAVSKSTATVTIGPGVSVYAGPDQTVKAGAPVQLAGTIAGVTTGTWSGGTGTFSNASLKNAVYTPGPGEVKVTLTLTSATPAGNCGAKSDQVVITIVPAPTAPTAAGATICNGSSVTLSATAPGGSYAWYDAPSGGNLLGNGANYTTPVLTANTTYYVQTTISVNTSNRTPVTVTVNPRPAAPAAAGVSTCYNTAAVLTAQAVSGNTYQWFDAATGGSLLGSGATFTTPPLTGNIAYYVQAVSNGCASVRTQVPVAITHAPVLTSAATGKVCSGTALNYTITSDAANAVYTWARPQVAGISNPAVTAHAAGVINETLINTGITPVTVTYNITAADNTCTTTFQYVVTVNPTPVVTSANKLTICNEASLNYTITLNDPDATFTWAREAVTGVSNATITGQAASTIREVLHNVTNVPVDVTYVVTFNKGDCTSTFNFTVTVNPYVYITSPNTVAICNGNLFNYQIVANAPAATFNWRRDATPGISNPGVSNQTSATIAETLMNTSINPINVSYYIQPTINGCQGPVSQLIVTVYPVPVTPAANSNSPVCMGSTIRLQTPIVPNASYLWTGPNGYTSTQQNPEIAHVTAGNAGTYTLSVIVNGCPSPPANAVVQINAPSVANAGTDQTVCATIDKVQLAGAVTGSNTGIWSTSGSGTFEPNNGVLNAQYIPSDQDRAAGSVNLSLASASKDDCAISVSVVKITFGPTPAVNAGSSLELCAQTNVVPLNGQSIKGGPVFWTTSGTGTFSAATQLNSNYIASPADITKGSVTLTLHYTNATVCDIATNDMVIKFIPPARVDAGGIRYVLKGHTITLEPTVSDANVTYLWMPNIGLSDNKIKNPVVTGDVDRIYTLTVTDVRGCVSSDQAAIKVSPLIHINNTFTPNGDGINDLWTITGLIAYENAVVDVFDRYGGKVYHSIGYDKAWDGTYNGQQLPTGTYYYVIRLNLNGQVLSGYVAIVR